MMHATKGQEPARTDWMHHFIRPALVAYETQLAKFNPNPFATGSEVGLAEICLIPQLYNANRWGVDYSDLLRINAAEQACALLQPFRSAHPDFVANLHLLARQQLSHQASFPALPSIHHRHQGLRLGLHKIPSSNGPNRCPHSV
ncbi:Maleylacetoacetate isomerase [Nymphon striatum]|nr:Maleylacetoacetate isomerase [Nymphon striatum]